MLFAQMLWLCAKLGLAKLGIVAQDGAKIKADASLMLQFATILVWGATVPPVKYPLGMAMLHAPPSPSELNLRKPRSFQGSHYNNSRW